MDNRLWLFVVLSHFRFCFQLTSNQITTHIHTFLIYIIRYTVVPGILEPWSYNFQSSKQITWTDGKFWKINMSRDGIIGSLFDHFHYFMISQSTLFLRLKNYKTWSYIPGTTVHIYFLNL